MAVSSAPCSSCSFRASAIKRCWCRDSAFETGNRVCRISEIFLSGAGKQEINPRHHHDRGKDGGESDFQTLIHRVSVADHSFGDGKRVKCRLRDLLPLGGDAHLFQELFVGSQGAQLHADASQKLGRIPRARDGVVGSEVKAHSTIVSPGANKDDHANRGRKGGAANRRQRFTSAQRALHTINPCPARASLRRHAAGYRDPRAAVEKAETS